MTGQHIIVVDLGYGDAGKGSVVDWLCSRPGNERSSRPGNERESWPGNERGSWPRSEPARTVVRFNGGAQAGHNVVTPDGRHHTFAQFGSGTFTPGVRTHLSRFMLVDPLALAGEAAHLARVGVPDALDRLTVDRGALITTPYHRAANRARELARGADRHGSCGMGVGETASYALRYPAQAPRAGDCDAPRALARKLAILRDRLTGEVGPLDVPPVADVCAAYRAFADRVPLVDSAYLHRLLLEGPVVFEGAQGILLDEWHGFHPYTTWSTTTFGNADTLLAEAGMTAMRLGVSRCYMTRHGRGPLVTEDPTLELPERHNDRNYWQGPFRVGHFDAVALRYAIEVAGGVDALALTHLDVAEHQPLRLCDAYLVDGQRMDRLAVGREHDLDRQERLTRMLLRARPEYASPSGAWPAAAVRALGVPVALVSAGWTALEKVAFSTASAADPDRSRSRPRFGRV